MQVRIGLHSTRLPPTNLNGAFSSSPLQRWLSTSSRACFRDHPRPPRQESRKFMGFLDKIPQNAIFYGIIVLNSAVFMMWFMAHQQWKQQRDPSEIFWMQRNFTNSWNNIVSGRIWTPLTACFSHENLPHILLNGFTFFFMGPTVLEILGSRQFIFLYLGAGMFSSFTSIAYARITGKKTICLMGQAVNTGAIFSIITYLACVAPTMQFALYGIIPVPAWLAVSGLFAYDMYSTISDTSGTIDTVGHVGGVLGGFLYFVGKRFRMF
ncbi:hypothetical protein BJ912DRAFT_860398 [Pholiota molesta]|nr:hypothetical protein BJ912DRAFT_860398 [Pholiota molesta]